jgi:replicative DNA helicase
MNNTPFTPLFECQLLANLIQLPKTYTQYHSIWKSEYFNDINLKKISQAYIRVRESGNEHPTEISLIQELTKAYEDKSIFPMDVQNLLNELSELYKIPAQNVQYSLNEIRDWAKQHEVRNAVLTSVDFIESNQPEKIIDVVSKAMAVGSDLQNKGIMLNKDTKNPSKILLKIKEAFLPIGLPTFDKKFDGGLRPGEMLTIIGATGSFKSGTMLNMCMPALQQPYGKNVTYITLEMSEEQVFMRTCFRITKHDKDFLTANPDKFDENFAECINKYIGQLHIKEFGTGTMTVAMLRNWLDNLEQEGHKTGLLIIDYPQLMSKPEREKDYIAVGDLYGAARAIAIERHIPVIVAAQTNREALSNPEKVDLKHISASMDIARHSDYIIAIMQTEEEYKQGNARFKLIKNRNEECGIIINVYINYKIYWIQDLGEYIPQEDSEEENESNNSYGNSKKRAARSNMDSSTSSGNGIAGVKDLLAKLQADKKI